ncbi:hypothetical protein DFH07DRAFT_768887 [Mycena maculata]|uniref:Uncharacterized protein n=1 Tax=Mycena maculata TaxID=230809 RepID=A0AAD7JT01_9AGAR|nr:hypothetical protein DFH07DRAFT_768887 [Mycena maculata]
MTDIPGGFPIDTPMDDAVPTIADSMDADPQDTPMVETSRNPLDDVDAERGRERDARQYAVEKAKAANRQAKEYEAELRASKQQFRQLADEQQALAEKFAAERETFDAERAGAQGYINHLNDTFLTQLQEAQAKAMSEANQKAAAVIQAREDELKAELNRAAKELEDEKARHRQNEEKRQAEYESAMAALRTRESPQRRGARHRNDSAPDGTPVHTTELVSSATREQRRVEALMRTGTDRFPAVTMAAPEPDPLGAPPVTAAAAPAVTPEQPGATGNEALAKIVAEEIAKAMKKLQKATAKRRRRNAPVGVRNELADAKREQQAKISDADDKSWKKYALVIWRHAQGKNRAIDFEDYQGATESVMLRAQAGHGESPTMSSKLWFGRGWETCVWNSLIIDKCVEELRQKREADTAHYNVPDVTAQYLKSLFMGHLKQTYGEWSRVQQRVGERPEDASERAKAYLQQL